MWTDKIQSVVDTTTADCFSTKQRKISSTMIWANTQAPEDQKPEQQKPEHHKPEDQKPEDQKPKYLKWIWNYNF